MYKELTEDNLEQIVKSETTVVVQYSAGWCGNCRLMKPKFRNFAADYEDATFLLVDAEKYPESRKLANVNNLPTFAVFKNGVFADQVQTNKAESLKQFIDETANN